MKSTSQIYAGLLDDFLRGKISAEEFQKFYLKKFKNEEPLQDENLYDLLEEVFGDVDSYTTDEELLGGNPDFYLDEKRLRERMRSALMRLSKLYSPSN